MVMIIDTEAHILGVIEVEAETKLHRAKGEDPGAPQELILGTINI